VIISVADAVLRRFKDGAWVRAFNDRGAFEAQAMVSDDVNVGFVIAALGL
jgi:anaerobic selenocysteine-containing dehydrogenase